MIGEEVGGGARIAAALDVFRRSCSSITGLSPSGDQLSQFRRYLDLLTRWGRVQRLVGPRTPEAVVRELFQDALFFVAQLSSGSLRLADLGSGAGIPGIPIKILRPEIETALIESMSKRVSFLSTVSRELGLTGVDVIAGRAEDVLREKPELRSAFDVVVSRSVGQAIGVSARGYLKIGGVYIAGASESKRIRRAVEVDGLELERRTLGKGGESRALLVGRRVS